MNGLDLHYLTWQSLAETSEACLLLHGSTGNAYVWERVARELSKHMRVIAPDLRGHGESDWANPPAYRCGDFAGDIASLIDALSLKQVSIVAHSMSVFHTLRHAASQPAGLRKLVLVDIEPTGRAEHREILRAAGRKPERRFRSVDEAVERERRIIPAADEELVRQFVEHNLRELAETAELTYRYDPATLAQFDCYDEWDRLATIQCPTLILYGTESLLVSPDTMRRAADELPQGELAAVPGGHLPHLENPQVFSQVVLDFLAD